MNLVGNLFAQSGPWAYVSVAYLIVFGSFIFNLIALKKENKQIKTQLKLWYQKQ